MPLFEPNDVFGQAIPTEITPAEPVFVDTAIIGDGPALDADVDLYRVQLNAGDLLVIDTDTPIGLEEFDPVLRVFDAAGMQRAFSDDDPAPDEMPSLEAFIDFVAPHTGTYFVGVSGFGNVAYNPQLSGSGTSGSTGVFDVTLTLLPSFELPGEGGFPFGEPGDEPFPPLPPEPMNEEPPPEAPPEVELIIDLAGNDIENADTLGLDSNGAGSVDGAIDVSGDRDVYRITTSQAGLLRVRQTAGPGSNLDTFVSVFNSDGELIAQNDDDGLGLNSLVQFPVSADTDFFVQAGAFGDTTGTFRIEIDLSNATTDDFGNNAASAAPLPLGREGQAQRFGEIETFGDRDVFRVVATQAGVLSIRQRAVPGSEVDSFLRVRDDSGNELGVNDDDANSLNSLLQIPVVENQTVFIEAGAFGTSRGRYELVVSPGEPVRDDAGDAVATAVSLADNLNGRIVRPGRIDRPGDRDVYRFVPTESGRLTVRQRAEPGEPLDTFLRILDANGQSLASNDDDGFSLNSRVSVPVRVGEAIFIEASAFGQSVGNYVVEIEAEAGATDDFGNDIASANTAGGVEFRGQIEATGDVDVFQVQTTQTGLLTIRQRATPGSSLDSFLSILDSNGDVLVTNDDDRFSLNSVVTVSVTAGDTIFLEAGAFSTSTGRYIVTVSSDTDDFSDALGNSATAITLDSNGQGVRSGSINFDSDVDVFRLVPASDAVVTIDLTANPGEPLDAFLEILSSDQELILVDDDGGDGLNSRVTIDVKSGETYFVRASSFGATTGTYRVSVSSTFELDDVGNTFPDARLVALDETGTGTSQFSLSDRTDVDVFQFVATASGDATLLVESDGQTAPGRVLVFEETDDSDVTDRNHIRVARDSDGDGEVTFAVVEGTTYFVEVAQGSGAAELQLTTDTTVTDEAKIDDDVAADAADLFRLGLASILVGETDESSLDVFTATLEETAEFLRDKLGTDEPLLILGLDPVDYVVTDASGRQAGFTATAGEINEVGSNVYNSGDGVAELLVISGPGAEVFQLQLVGVGTEFRGGAAFVDSSGVQTTTFDGTLTKENLEVALDFSNTETAAETPGTAPARTAVEFFASVSDSFTREESQEAASETKDFHRVTGAAESIADGFDESEESALDGDQSGDAGDLIDSLMSWLTERTSEDQEVDLVDRAWASLSESILEISSGALEVMTQLLETVDRELSEEKQATQEPDEDTDDTQAAAKKTEQQQRTADSSAEDKTADAKPDTESNEKPVTTARATAPAEQPPSAL